MRGTRDPSRHDAATLQRFLDTYDPSKAVDVDHARLWNTVKKAQQDPSLKALWIDFCARDSLGPLKGTRDPSRHSKETLESFLNSIGSGEAGGAQGGAQGGARGTNE